MTLNSNTTKNLQTLGSFAKHMVGSNDAVLLTLAHLDHSGFVPRLSPGLQGPGLLLHPATRDLCEMLLRVQALKDLKP